MTKIIDIKNYSEHPAHKDQELFYRSAFPNQPRDHAIDALFNYARACQQTYELSDEDLRTVLAHVILRIKE
jgi:hypothetical protein